MLEILVALKNPPEAIMGVLKDHKVDALRENESLFKVIEKSNYDLILLQ